MLSFLLLAVGTLVASGLSFSDWPTADCSCQPFSCQVGQGIFQSACLRPTMSVPPYSPADKCDEQFDFALAGSTTQPASSSKGPFTGCSKDGQEQNDPICAGLDSNSGFLYFTGENCIPLTSKSSGDPHHHGAHDDTFDLRGRDGVTFNLLSAQNISLGMTTRDADFMLPRQKVHGSFFTEAFFVLRTQESGHMVRVFSNASRAKDTFEVQVLGLSKAFGNHRTFVHEDVSVQSKEVKLVVKAAGWEVTLTRRKINQPLGEIKFRFDLSLLPSKGDKDFVVWPHGILGQTFDGDSIAVDGKTDVYHNAGPEFTTTAMAEGAIEGSAEDYVLQDPFSPDFKYSRFSLHDPTPPRDISKLTGTRRMAEAGIKIAGATEVEGA